MSSYLLRADNVAMDFGGFRAVDGVSLGVKERSIHAIIGPNGAGKTTFFNILTKFLIPTAGRVFLEERDITAVAPARLAQAGIVRSFQISSTFESMSALENVRAALLRRAGGTFRFLEGGGALSRLDAQAEEYLAKVGLAHHRHTLARELSYGAKRALELGTTLALEPKILLLDEPMAGISREEVARITALIRSAASDRTVLMIEHNLSVVAELSDIITVLVRGRVLMTGRYQEVASNREVVEAYMGTEDDDAE
jgi:branched-chain amino acid transport system ATP-binding protein